MNGENVRCLKLTCLVGVLDGEPNVPNYNV